MPDFIPLTSLMSAARPPDHIVAVRANGDEITWAKFSNEIGLVCAGLEKEPSGHYVLACDDIYYFLVAFMALLAAGRHVVIPPNLQPEMLALIAMRDQSAVIKDGDIEALLLREGAMPVPQDIRRADMTVTAYSSGSTGQPAATVKPIRALEDEVRMLHGRWAAEVRNTIFASSVTHYHAYGLPFQLLWPLCAGEKILLKRITYPEELFHYRQGGEMSFISSPVFLNQHVRLLDDAAPYDFLRFVSSAGAPLPAETARKMNAALPAPVIEIYGSTETGAMATRSVATGSEWTCLEQVDLAHDPDDNLMVRSPYTGQPDYVALKDRVEILEDGRFLLTGRSDRVVKIHQKRISLTELEKNFEAAPWIKTARVMLGPTGRLACVAVLSTEGQDVLRKGGKRAVIDHLRAHLRTCFDLVVFPRKWRFVEALPVNDMGKVLNADLLALFEKGTE